MFWSIFSDLCTQKGMKPSKVAEECGINRSNVSLWKSRGYIPRPDALKRIAEFFDVSTDYLLGKEKNPVINDDDGSKTDFFDKGKIAADIMSRLSPENQDAALNYLRYLAQQETEKT